ncbi:RNA polymerase-associated protein CTR9 homolog [Drosophila obscura]|uniref:RNA polymerase-associated protein CTR9 homolog n=1 Tax=Drosophila obscura TaxID=7282 RepID=UPI001BB2513C|nr:RNA polymerase-associated protein CTR9 homolog [Drosophila obscura]
MDENHEERQKLRWAVGEAVNYYRSGDKSLFVSTLETGIKKCVVPYSNYKYDLSRSYILLAAKVIREAHKEMKKGRPALLAKFINLIEMVDTDLMSSDYQYLLTYGYGLMLTARRAQEADNMFANVLHRDGGCVPALIGRGCLAYNRKSYSEALAFFQSVLEYEPRGQCDVRVGIAHCFLKKNDLKKARRFFELAIVQNGRSQEAVLGLALLQLRKSEPQAMKEGMNLLSAAHELNMEHPSVLSYLARHFFFVGRHEVALALAGKALHLTDHPGLLAQICYQIARSSHATGMFDKAVEYYNRSVRAHPVASTLAPNYIGMAQMWLLRGEADTSERILEILRKLRPEHPFTLRLLSALYLRDKSPKKLHQATDMLGIVLNQDPNDYDSWILLAQIYELMKLWSKTVRAYQQAIHVCLAQGLTVPIEWMNNLGNAQTKNKQPLEAIDTFDQALDRGTDCEIIRFTLLLNRSRALEELHRFDLAEISYNALLREYPANSDCSVRLGIMAAKRKKWYEAVEHFKDAFGKDVSGQLIARIYLINCYAKMGQNHSALKNSNVILARCDKMFADSCMVVAGNLSFGSMQSCLARGEITDADRHANNALRSYRIALKYNRQNQHAANGIAAVCSTLGLLRQSQLVFKTILETRQRCPEAILNLAHVSLQRGQYKEASQTYKLCMRQEGNRNSVEVIQGLAQALYMMEETRDAKIWLLKARLVAPDDPVVLYNLALAIKEDTMAIFDSSQPEMHQLELAELELKVALRHFEHLSTLENEEQIDIEEAQQQVESCRRLLANLPQELIRGRELAAQESERQRLLEKRYQMYQCDLERQRLKRDQEQRLLKETQQAKRNEILEYMKRSNEQSSKTLKKYPQKRSQQDDKEQESPNRKKMRSPSPNTSPQSFSINSD